MRRFLALPGYILGALITVICGYNIATLTLAQPAGTLGLVDWAIITGILALAYLVFALYIDMIIIHIKERK